MQKGDDEKPPRAHGQLDAAVVLSRGDGDLDLVPTDALDDASPMVQLGSNVSNLSLGQQHANDTYGRDADPRDFAGDVSPTHSFQGEATTTALQSTIVDNDDDNDDDEAAALAAAKATRKERRRVLDEIELSAHTIVDPQTQQTSFDEMTRNDRRRVAVAAMSLLTSTKAEVSPVLSVDKFVAVIAAEASLPVGTLRQSLAAATPTRAAVVKGDDSSPAGLVASSPSADESAKTVNNNHNHNEFDHPESNDSAAAASVRIISVLSTLLHCRAFSSNTSTADGHVDAHRDLSTHNDDDEGQAATAILQHEMTSGPLCLLGGSALSSETATIQSFCLHNQSTNANDDSSVSYSFCTVTLCSTATSSAALQHSTTTTMATDAVKDAATATSPHPGVFDWTRTFIVPGAAVASIAASLDEALRHTGRVDLASLSKTIAKKSCDSSDESRQSSGTTSDRDAEFVVQALLQHSLDARSLDSPPSSNSMPASNPPRRSFVSLLQPLDSPSTTSVTPPAIASGESKPAEVKTRRFVTTLAAANEGSLWTTEVRTSADAASLLSDPTSHGRSRKQSATPPTPATLKTTSSSKGKSSSNNASSALPGCCTEGEVARCVARFYAERFQQPDTPLRTAASTAASTAAAGAVANQPPVLAQDSTGSSSVRSQPGSSPSVASLHPIRGTCLVAPAPGVSIVGVTDAWLEQQLALVLAMLDDAPRHFPVPLMFLFEAPTPTKSATSTIPSPSNDADLAARQSMSDGSHQVDVAVGSPAALNHGMGSPATLDHGREEERCIHLHLLPKLLKELQCSRRLPGRFIVDEHDVIFVSSAYDKARDRQILQELEADGFVSFCTVSALGIDDPEAHLKSLFSFDDAVRRSLRQANEATTLPTSSAGHSMDPVNVAKDGQPTFTATTSEGDTMSTAARQLSYLSVGTPHTPVTGSTNTDGTFPAGGGSLDFSRAATLSPTVETPLSTTHIADAAGGDSGDGEEHDHDHEPRAGGKRGRGRGGRGSRGRGRGRGRGKGRAHAVETTTESPDRASENQTTSTAKPAGQKSTHSKKDDAIGTAIRLEFVLDPHVISLSTEMPQTQAVKGCHVGHLLSTAFVSEQAFIDLAPRLKAVAEGYIPVYTFLADLPPCCSDALDSDMPLILERVRSACPSAFLVCDYVPPATLVSPYVWPSVAKSLIGIARDKAGSNPHSAAGEGILWPTGRSPPAAVAAALKARGGRQTSGDGDDDDNQDQGGWGMQRQQSVSGMCGGGDSRQCSGLYFGQDAAMGDCCGGESDGVDRRLVLVLGRALGWVEPESSPVVASVWLGPWLHRTVAVHAAALTERALASGSTGNHLSLSMLQNGGHSQQQQHQAPKSSGCQSFSPASLTSGFGAGSAETQRALKAKEEKYQSAVDALWTELHLERRGDEWLRHQLADFDSELSALFSSSSPLPSAAQHDENSREYAGERDSWQRAVEASYIPCLAFYGHCATLLRLEPLCRLCAFASLLFSPSTAIGGDPPVRLHDAVRNAVARQSMSGRKESKKEIIAIVESTVQQWLSSRCASSSALDRTGQNRPRRNSIVRDNSPADDLFSRRPVLSNAVSNAGQELNTTTATTGTNRGESVAIVARPAPRPILRRPETLAVADGTGAGAGSPPIAFSAVRSPTTSPAPTPMGTLDPVSPLLETTAVGSLSTLRNGEQSEGVVTRPAVLITRHVRLPSQNDIEVPVVLTPPRVGSRRSAREATAAHGSAVTSRASSNRRWGGSRGGFIGSGPGTAAGTEDDATSAASAKLYHNKATRTPTSVAKSLGAASSQASQSQRVTASDADACRRALAVLSAPLTAEPVSTNPIPMTTLGAAVGAHSGGENRAASIASSSRSGARGAGSRRAPPFSLAALLASSGLDQGTAAEALYDVEDTTASLQSTTSHFFAGACRLRGSFLDTEGEAGGENRDDNERGILDSIENNGGELNGAASHSSNARFYLSLASLQEDGCGCCTPELLHLASIIAEADDDARRAADMAASGPPPAPSAPEPQKLMDSSDHSEAHVKLSRPTMASRTTGATSSRGHSTPWGNDSLLPQTQAGMPDTWSLLRTLDVSVSVLTARVSPNAVPLSRLRTSHSARMSPSSPTPAVSHDGRGRQALDSGAFSVSPRQQNRCRNVVVAVSVPAPLLPEADHLSTAAIGRPATVGWRVADIEAAAKPQLKGTQKGVHCMRGAASCSVASSSCATTQDALHALASLCRTPLLLPTPMPPTHQLNASRSTATGTRKENTTLGVVSGGATSGNPSPSRDRPEVSSRPSSPATPTPVGRPPCAIPRSPVQVNFTDTPNAAHIADGGQSDSSPMRAASDVTSPSTPTMIGTPPHLPPPSPQTSGLQSTTTAPTTATVKATPQPSGSGIVGAPSAGSSMPAPPPPPSVTLTTACAKLEELSRENAFGVTLKSFGKKADRDEAKHLRRDRCQWASGVIKAVKEALNIEQHEQRVLFYRYMKSDRMKEHAAVNEASPPPASSSIPPEHMAATTTTSSVGQPTSMTQASHAGTAQQKVQQASVSGRHQALVLENVPLVAIATCTVETLPFVHFTPCDDEDAEQREFEAEVEEEERLLNARKTALLHTLRAKGTTSSASLHTRSGSDSAVTAKLKGVGSMTVAGAATSGTDCRESNARVDHESAADTSPIENAAAGPGETGTVSSEEASGTAKQDCSNVAPTKRNAKPSDGFSESTAVGGGSQVPSSSVQQSASLHDAPKTPTSKSRHHQETKDTEAVLEEQRYEDAVAAEALRVNALLSNLTDSLVAAASTLLSLALGAEAASSAGGGVVVCPAVATLRPLALHATDTETIRAVLTARCSSNPNVTSTSASAEGSSKPAELRGIGPDALLAIAVVGALAKVAMPSSSGDAIAAKAWLPFILGQSSGRSSTAEGTTPQQPKDDDDHVDDAAKNGANGDGCGAPRSFEEDPAIARSLGCGSVRSAVAILKASTVAELIAGVDALLAAVAGSCV